MELRRAKARSKAGLTRELQVHRDHHLSDPSRGGLCGYLLYQQEEVLNLIHQHGSVNAAIEDGGACPSQVMMYRWIDHIEPYQMTGNHQQEYLMEEDQLLLAIYTTYGQMPVLKRLPASFSTTMAASDCICQRLSEND